MGEATTISAVLILIVAGFIVACLAVIVQLLIIKMFLAVPPIRHLAQSIYYTIAYRTD